jgi:prepilin-type N-terminal cleavage/methylation domain-containing protein
MERSSKSVRGGGFTVLEVLIALILLGVVSVIYVQTSRYSQKNTGKSVDWQAEGVVIEKTFEQLRTGHTLKRLQSFDSSWTDSTGNVRIQVRAKGGVPPASVCKGGDPEQLAMVTVFAKREHFGDSIDVTAYLWVN